MFGWVGVKGNKSHLSKKKKTKKLKRIGYTTCLRDEPAAILLAVYLARFAVKENILMEIQAEHY